MLFKKNTKRKKIDVESSDMPNKCSFPLVFLPMINFFYLNSSNEAEMRIPVEFAMIKVKGESSEFSKGIFESIVEFLEDAIFPCELVEIYLKFHPLSKMKQLTEEISSLDKTILNNEKVMNSHPSLEKDQLKLINQQIEEMQKKNHEITELIKILRKKSLDFSLQELTEKIY